MHANDSQKDNGHLITLKDSLIEVEETAKLIHVEVEEAGEQIHQHPQALTDTVPTHLILQILLHQLLDCIRQVMAVDTVAVLLLTENGQQLAVRATLGLEEEITEEIRIPIGRGFAGYIAASCKPMIVDNLSTVEVVSPILRDKIRSAVGVPLLVKDRVIGVFHVGTVRLRQFTQDDVQLLQCIADRVGLAIDHLKSLILFSVTEGSELVREKPVLPFVYQKVSRTIRNFSFHPYPTSFLRPAPPLL